MREKGFVWPLVLVLIVAVVAGAIGVSQVLKSKAPSSSQFPKKSCKLAVEDRFFPDALLEYKFQQRITDDGALNVIYSNGREVGDSLKISDEIWVRLIKEDNFFSSPNLSRENIKNQSTYKKALRDEMSEEEFKEFENFWDEGVMIVKRESIAGVSVVVFDYQTMVEGPPLSIEYTDKETGVSFYMGFGKKIENYQTYFENWYRQVCS